MEAAETSSVGEQFHALRAKYRKPVPSPAWYFQAYKGRRETAHSAALAWLLDPHGSHGLDDAVLRRLLNAGWQAIPRGVLENAIVRAEAGHDKTRADALVNFGAGSLVVEVKVDAPERPHQCDDLVLEWGPESLYLFVTLDGRSPTSARRSQGSWRTLSFGSLLQLLRELAPTGAASGQAELQDYIQRLESLLGKGIGPIDRFAVGTYIPRWLAAASSDSVVREGEWQRDDDAFSAIERQFRNELRNVVNANLDRTLARLRRLEGPSRPVRGAIGGFRSSRARAHPVYWRQRWEDEEGQPRVAIGMDAYYDRTHYREEIFAGLFVVAGGLKDALKVRLRSELHMRFDTHWRIGVYPIGWHQDSRLDAWWRDREATQRVMTEEVVSAWRRFADWVDRNLGQVDASGSSMEDPALGS